MRCVSCGCAESLHVRADGHCLGCSCPSFLAAWPVEETPAETPKAKAKPAKAEAEKV